MKRNNNKRNGKKKNFAPTIGFWRSNSGNGYRVMVSEELLKILGGISEGDTLFLSEVDSDNENAPSYRVAILPKREREEEEGI